MFGSETAPILYCAEIVDYRYSLLEECTTPGQMYYLKWLAERDYPAIRPATFLPLLYGTAVPIHVLILQM
jgi:hypothetical protein